MSVRNWVKDADAQKHVPVLTEQLTARRYKTPFLLRLLSQELITNQKKPKTNHENQ
jgi:hypothetical protein